MRRPGGGRKRAAEVDPGLRPALLALVEPEERGDPVSPLRWTAKSTRELAAELTAQGHQVSATRSVSCCGRGVQPAGQRQDHRGYPAPGPGCAVPLHQRAGPGPPGRRGPGDQRGHQEEGAGRRLQTAGGNAGRRAARCRCHHDFADKALGKAVPYGVYDVAANAGWVNVGTDHDTAAFAVESIRRWWNAMGRAAYPRARRLLVTADAGGSNGYRTRAWKTELAAFALEAGLAITVCHFPPGTSKWNKIEHRLFSPITLNWRGRPLTSHEVIVEHHRRHHHPHRADRPRRA